MTSFQRPLFRPDPTIPASGMRTFEIAAPLDTHWRKASCVEVGCLDHQYGWMIALTGLDDADREMARGSGRRYTEDQDDAGPVLIFAAGQPCFRASTHRIRLDRPELFISRDGDWRGNPRGTAPTVFSGPEPWADSLHTKLDEIREGI